MALLATRRPLPLKPKIMPVYSQNPDFIWNILSTQFKDKIDYPNLNKCVRSPLPLDWDCFVLLNYLLYQTSDSQWFVFKVATLDMVVSQEYLVIKFLFTHSHKNIFILIFNVWKFFCSNLAEYLQGRFFFFFLNSTETNYLYMQWLF